MRNFKMHPLHTHQDHLDRMKSLGVEGYHKWLAEKRCTGRSTAQALQLLAEAISNPGLHISIEDHANLERGLSGKRITSIDVGLQDLVRHMATKLGLEHIHTHARSSGPTVVFERRPARVEMVKESASVPPVPAQETRFALAERSSLHEISAEIRRLMRVAGYKSARTVEGDKTAEGNERIVFSRAQ